jgi:hypothetical protein
MENIQRNHLFTFPKILESECLTGIDQTLAANWTHGGIFITSFDIVIKKVFEKVKR